MTQVDLVEEMLDHPDAQNMVNQVQAALNKEQGERDKFREWLKEDVKAEFINGEIILHSPVKRGHLNASNNLSLLLTVYCRVHQLGVVSTEKALVSLTRNDYEPDICFWTNEQAANFDKETMIHPPPMFIVEILSKGTKSKDRGVKFQDYASHGVAEYWIIDYQKQLVEQYHLKNKEQTTYQLLDILKEKELIESTTIAGFKIPVQAIFDEALNLATLQRILQNQ